MRLPLFPLHTVLFPGAPLPLLVFEPRYRAMIADIYTEPRFGVVAISAGTEVGAPSQTHSVGTVAVIEQLAELDDGRYELVCRGEQRFEIQTRLPDDPYPLAQVRLLPDAEGADAEIAVAAAAAAFARYVVAVRTLGVAIDVPSLDDPVEASYALSRLLEVDVPVKQKLLACETASERLRLAGAIARRESTLMSTIGPSAGVPLGRPSPNQDRRLSRAS